MINVLYANLHRSEGTNIFFYPENTIHVLMIFLLIAHIVEEIIDTALYYKPFLL
jgi:hypothetical protein